MGEMHEKPEHVSILEQWMKSYRPAELFDDSGRLQPELADLAPEGRSAHERQSRTPTAALLLRDLRLPDFRDYAVKVPQPGATTAEATRVMGRFLRDVMKLNMRAAQLPALQPGRKQLQSLAGRPRSHRSRLGR